MARASAIAILIVAASLGFLAIAPAKAAPIMPLRVTSPEPAALPVGSYGRRGPPVLPHYYAPARRPGGWSFYFGFVPYGRGDYEVQALQRRYPQTNWPPSMRYWTPQSTWGP